jgi:hypothetical protein
MLVNVSRSIARSDEITKKEEDPLLPRFSCAATEIERKSKMISISSTMSVDTKRLSFVVFIGALGFR